MIRRTLIVTGGLWGVALLVLALWAWQNDGNIAFYFHARNLSVASWAVRCAAISLLAGGEALLVVFVVGNVWRRDWLTNALGLSAVLVLLLSAASAVALGLAGR